MVLRIFLFVLCPFCMLLSACGGGGAGTVSASDTPVSSGNVNNSALLVGPQLGIQTENNGDLSKSITVTQNSTDFQVGHATITRDDTQGSFFYVTVQMKNVSTQVLCEITLSNIQYQSIANGTTATLASASEGYVLGSYGKMNSGIRRSNCLAPGQTGYFLDGIQDDGSFTFNDLNNVDINSVGVTVTDKISDDQILPQSYTVSADSIGVTANVTVHNKTAFDAMVYSPGCKYILLDANGMPLIWGYFLTDPTTVDILPNDTLNITGGVYFTGSAKKMVVYLVYN